MTAPAVVFVLIRETNTGRASEQADGYVDGVYRERADAEAAAKAARAVSVDWEADWRVEEWAVQ